MEYISHEDFKGFMNKLQANTPKGMLQEIHKLEHDGAEEFHKLPVDLEGSGMNEELENEGNAFTAGLAKAKKGEKFKVDGKTVKDTSNYDASMEEASYTDNYEGSWGYREGAGEETSDGSHMSNPDTVAKIVAKKHGAELKPLFDKYQASHEQYMQDIRAKKPNQQELAKAHNAIVKAFQNQAISWAGHEMLEAGMNKTKVDNLLSGYGYFEDWLMDYISAVNKELKGVAEGLHMPPLQATGQTIVANEDQTNRFSVLSPSEREQLKEYINSVKTIKQEISKLLEKAGMSGKIMESNKEEDENVPAERKPVYNEPTKKSKPGGNRTGLVMTKAEMWEGEGERSLSDKLHSTFAKVTDLAIKELVASGLDPMEAVSFLKHEIEEKAKQATMSQYDF